MNEKIRNFLTKKRASPVRLIRDKFFSANAESKSNKNKNQNPFTDNPNTSIQLLRDRFDLLNNSHKNEEEKRKKIEDLKCFEEKLNELKEIAPSKKTRDEIENLLRDTRESLADKYDDGLEG